MNAGHAVPVAGSSDLLLPGGCFLCGGDLAVRVTPGGAASCCASCRRISRAHLVQEEGGVRVLHPAGGIA